MGILDIFKRKQAQNNEANTLFGQTALGNNVVYQGDNRKPTVNTQILYVTTSAVTDAGRVVDMSTLSRNGTVMSAVGAKARALAQLPIKIMCELDDGTVVDAAKELENHARTQGIHAAGVVIATQPLDNIVPLCRPTGGGAGGG